MRVVAHRFSERQVTATLANINSSAVRFAGVGLSAISHLAVSFSQNVYIKYIHCAVKGRRHRYKVWIIAWERLTERIERSETHYPIRPSAAKCSGPAVARLCARISYRHVVKRHVSNHYVFVSYYHPDRVISRDARFLHRVAYSRFASPSYANYSMLAVRLGSIDPRCSINRHSFENLYEKGIDAPVGVMISESPAIDLTKPNCPLSHALPLPKTVRSRKDS